MRFKIILKTKTEGKEAYQVQDTSSYRHDVQLHMDKEAAQKVCDIMNEQWEKFLKKPF